MIPLPIDDHIPEVVAALDRHRAAVLVADPGAGKTTRVPPALMAAGPVLLLQPRRAAARAIAQRIAFERGWTTGREVGWHIRHERRLEAGTQLIVATEGILTARLQQDPLLSSFRTIVLDEFHERSVHADLGIALTKQAWRARDDLRLLVMSATLDADRVASFLDDCPVIRVPGRMYPVEVGHAPGQSAADACVELSGVAAGVLCFLPGAFEIGKAVADISARLGAAVDVLPLHGLMDTDTQALVLGEPAAGRRRVIVATNIAETSVTVPGVTAVVDAGLQKVARYDAARAIDSLATERVTQDAADQRAGRAGRIAPGMARRLWDARDRLRPHREAEIHRIDLSAVVLDVLAWGGDPDSLDWFERPRPDAISAARQLLTRLGAVAVGGLTDIGRRMQAWPLHPRLGRIMLAGAGDRRIAQACAVLSERLLIPPRSDATASDLLSAIDRWSQLPPHVHRVARDLEALIPRPSAPLTDFEFCRAIFAGYPDRVAHRRAPASARVKLASGTGATIAASSGVTTGEFIVALDIQASTRASDPDGVVRLASVVDREWLMPTSLERVHTIDASGAVRAADVARYDALVLAEHPVRPDEEVVATLLAELWMTRDRPPGDARLLRRLAFAGVEVDLADLARRAARGARSLADLRVQSALSQETTSRLDRYAPDSLVVPSGRSVPLQYQDDGSVSASVKLQELFGLGETPRIGPRREPVVFALLAPNGRPVQVTRDLRSFWNRTYPDVRKELRGRYPRHPWPEDPWSAPPTARTTKRRS